MGGLAVKSDFKGFRDRKFGFPAGHSIGCPAGKPDIREDSDMHPRM